MPEKFRELFNIGSVRYPDHDYSSPGKYFITICTLRMESWFGSIKNGEIVLSCIGQIARRLWYEIPVHFPEISLDEFVVMPNHIHGIIIIKSNVETLVKCRDVACNVSTKLNNATSLQKNARDVSTKQNNAATSQQIQCQRIKGDNNFMSSISPKPGSLSVVIRSYKSAVARESHNIEKGFSWLPRYYDHIIRSETEMDKIRSYIRNNPKEFGDM